MTLQTYPQQCWIYQALKTKHKKDLDFENYMYGYHVSYGEDGIGFMINGFPVDLEDHYLKNEFDTGYVTYRNNVDHKWRHKGIEMVFETFIKQGSMIERRRFYQLRR